VFFWLVLKKVIFWLTGRSIDVIGGRGVIHSHGAKAKHGAKRRIILIGEAMSAERSFNFFSYGISVI
jgi:hypothetical protein